MTQDKARNNRSQVRRPPKKATATHLGNVALWYLQRFAASADSLRKVLMRRVEKSARAHGTDREEGAPASPRYLDPGYSRAPGRQGRRRR